MLNVQLLAFTPQPEQTVAAAARLCYSPSTIDELMDGMTEEKTASFVDMLAEIGHESPIEHASFTFGIEGVSRSLLAQITRHRLASFSVQSQRYVAEDHFEFVLPPEIEAIPEAKEEYLRAMEEDQRHYERLKAVLAEKHVEAFLQSGMSQKAAERAAEKKAIEDARFVLPTPARQNVVTMNARSRGISSGCAVATAPNGRFGSWRKKCCICAGRRRPICSVPPARAVWRVPAPREKCPADGRRRCVPAILYRIERMYAWDD